MSELIFSDCTLKSHRLPLLIIFHEIIDFSPKRLMPGAELEIHALNISIFYLFMEFYPAEFMIRIKNISTRICTCNNRLFCANSLLFKR